MIKHSENMRVEMRERVRGGEGTLRFRHMVEKDESYGKLNLCGVVDFEPGQSIGLHPHGPDAEIYYVLKGSLVVTDQGVEHTLNEGDAMFTGNGEVHGVKNSSDQPARLLAVVIA